MHKIFLISIVTVALGCERTLSSDVDQVAAVGAATDPLSTSVVYWDGEPRISDDGQKVIFLSGKCADVSCSVSGRTAYLWTISGSDTARVPLLAVANRLHGDVEAEISPDGNWAAVIQSNSSHKPQIILRSMASETDLAISAAAMQLSEGSAIRNISFTSDSAFLVWEAEDASGVSTVFGHAASTSLNPVKISGGSAETKPMVGKSGSTYYQVSVGSASKVYVRSGSSLSALASSAVSTINLDGFILSSGGKVIGSDFYYVSAVDYPNKARIPYGDGEAESQGLVYLTSEIRKVDLTGPTETPADGSSNEDTAKADTSDNYNKQTDILSLSGVGQSSSGYLTLGREYYHCLSVEFSSLIMTLYDGTKTRILPKYENDQASVISSVCDSVANATAVPGADSPYDFSIRDARITKVGSDYKVVWSTPQTAKGDYEIFYGSFSSDLSSMSRNSVSENYPE